jgi:hypothetical protein
MLGVEEQAAPVAAVAMTLRVTVTVTAAILAVAQVSSG